MELHKLKDISEPLAELNCRSGLMFYKLLCSIQAQFIFEHDDVNIDEDIYESETYESFCLEHLGFYIDDYNLFSNWIKPDLDFNVSNVMDACNALNRLSTPEFKKNASYIVDTLHSSLTKLGESTQVQTRTLSSAVYSIEELGANSIEDVNAELKIMLDNQGSQSQHSLTM
jgi:type I restriction enzyme M protein